MMMMMIEKLLKISGKSRRLHTIISRDTIKPSSPTPCHLQTYNLGLLDQCNHHAYIPAIFFYPNHSTPYNKAHHLKKSLSQTLNKFYPFAGRLPSPRPTYINCNDDGVAFLESCNDAKMADIVHVVEQDKAVRAQLFPDCLEWHNTGNSLSLIAVQLNHFACGGTAVAVSLSHKIADACTLGTFMTHWATLAQCSSSVDQLRVLPINPHFISFPSTDVTVPLAHLYHSESERVVKRFVFSNSKLSDLKKKVMTMAEKAGTPLDNPSRVQVLTSLLYKTAVAANTARSGCFEPSFLFTVANMRRKMVEKMPDSTVGNILSIFVIPSTNPSETELNVVASEMKKGKLELEAIQNLQHAYENFIALETRLENDDLEFISKRSYSVSSLCSFPLKGIDFGWGKPVFMTTPMGSMERSSFVLMSTPNGDGIEAQVNLERQDMEIIQNDKDLHVFCDEGGSN